MSRQPRPQGAEIPRSPLSCGPGPGEGHSCLCRVCWQWAEGLLSFSGWASGHWGAQAGLGFPAWPTSPSDTSPWLGLPSFCQNPGYQHPRPPPQPETPAQGDTIPTVLCLSTPSTSTLGPGQLKSLPPRLSFHLLCAGYTMGDNQPHRQSPPGWQQTRRQGCWAGCRKWGSVGRRRWILLPPPGDSLGWGSHSPRGGEVGS